MSLKNTVIITIESFGLNLFCLLTRLPFWWFDQIVSFNGKDLPGATRSVGAPIIELFHAALDNGQVSPLTSACANIRVEAHTHLEAHAAKSAIICSSVMVVLQFLR